MVINLTINGLGWRFPEIDNLEIILCETFYIDINKLRKYDQLYLVVQQYLLSLRLSSLYDALYKPSELVSLVKTTLTVC